MELIRHSITAARPYQWIKNLLLFVPLFLTGRLFNADDFVRVVIATVSFCLLSSSNYIVNDILDKASDKKHPVKRLRPLAAELIKSRQAWWVSLVFGTSGFVLAIFVGWPFFQVAVLFVLLHHLSYFILRRIEVVDVLVIASFYVLRVLAGEQAAHARISVWLLLTMLSASLLLAIGKRRHEFALIKKLQGTNKEKIIEHFIYPEKVLDAYVAVFASATFLSYTYFTFLSSPSEDGLFFKGYTEYLLSVLSRKWMMLTVPFMLYGIMRYVQLIYMGKGILAKVILSDKSLLITMFLWVAVVLFVVYGIGG